MGIEKRVERVKQLVEKGVSIADATKRMKMSMNTYYKHKKPKVQLMTVKIPEPKHCHNCVELKKVIGILVNT